MPVSERPGIVGVSLRDMIPLAERAVYDGDSTCGKPGRILVREMNAVARCELPILDSYSERTMIFG